MNVEEIFNYITEKTKGFYSPAELDKFFLSVEENIKRLGFAPLSFANLERIIKSLFDVRTFVSDSRKYPHYTEIITSIAHYSNFLTDIIVRNPTLVYQILTPSKLSYKISEEQLTFEISKGLLKMKSLESKTRFLRKFKNKYMLNIAIGDFMNIHSLEETTGMLSALARTIIEKLFEISLTEIFRRKNIRETELKYAIAALGKLGGNELNYSSDVDLLFFYDENISIPDSAFDTHEIIAEAIRLFTDEATKQTSDGFLYRIDFRLRPDGKYSPLAKSWRDYLYYYETRGENWERQMLIKLSFVSGDFKIFEKFKNYLIPFIFPHSIPSNFFRSVRKLKSEIEKSAGGKPNIKKFSGGIRDIEFSVQALQIINGHKKKILREANTLRAIKRLLNENLISGEEADKLELAYKFYRKVEHFLQLTDDLQTHTIPEKGEGLQKLLHYLNFGNEIEFFDYLNKTRNEIREIFNSVFRTESSDDYEIDFLESKKSKRFLNAILLGENLSGAKSYDKQTLDAAALFEPGFIRQLKLLEFPELALENVSKIISSIGQPSIFFREMKDEKYLNLFLRLSQYSRRFVNTLLRKPNFIEPIISRAVLFSELNKKESTEEFLFYLLVRVFAKIISPFQISGIISNYVKQKIINVAEKYFNDDVFILSLGSFAMGRMHFNSDVDLLIISTSRKALFSIEADAQNFLSEINRILSPFRIDMKLRPEGKSSQLIWNIDGLDGYFRKRISAWELISFAKGKFLFGDKKTYQDFIKIYYSKIATLNRAIFLNQLKSTYRKLLASKSFSLKSFDVKFSHGGITTVDFIALPKLILNSDANVVNPILDFYDKELLKIRDNFLAFVLLKQIMFDENNFLFSLNSEDKKRFISFLNYLSFNDCLNSIEESRKIISQKFGELYE